LSAIGWEYLDRIEFEGVRFRMAPTLKFLFENHLADLKDIYPLNKDIFICPICFRQYNYSDIKKEKLTRGDIWPKYIREKSGKQQIVLLCKDCNSLAGEHGDAQMNMIEQIKDGDEKGELYGKRRIQITKQDGSPLIKINAHVKKDKDTNAITLSWKLNNKEAWDGNDGRMKQTIEGLVGKAEPLSIFIDGNPIKETEPRPELAPVGWITSAYLFAFYTFGYRYIFHHTLDPVREYILSSFDKEQHKNLKASYATFGIREYKDKFFETPTIEIILPFEEEVIYLQIQLFKYQIKLPFHYSQADFSDFIYSRMPDINERLPELKKSVGHLYFEILNHSKANCPECMLDYILGKPIPAQT
jgi:hypothetical protein